MPRIELLTREGCHLCDEARAVLAAACERAGVVWRERDVDDDEAEAARYGELVPVLLVDGRLAEHWRLDPVRVARVIGGGT